MSTLLEENERLRRALNQAIRLCGLKVWTEGDLAIGVTTEIRNEEVWIRRDVSFHEAPDLCALIPADYQEAEPEPLGTTTRQFTPADADRAANMLSKYFEIYENTIELHLWSMDRDHFHIRRAIRPVRVSPNQLIKIAEIITGESVHETHIPGGPLP